jgi:hypothetical protein
MRALGAAVAATLVGFFLIMPFVLIVALYTFFTAYAITKGTTFDSNHLNVAVVFIGVVAVTALLICGLGVAVWAIDKAAGPIRSKDRAES